MLLFALLTLVFTPIHLAVAQSYQLHPVIGSGLLNASSSCQSVFSANVTCVNSIGQLYANPFYDPGDTELTALCTSACASSLDRQRTRVKGACQGAQYYDEYEDTYWLPQYPDEFMLYAYNVACLKRSTGEFCTSYLRNLKTAADCDECIIKTFQLQVNSPFAVDDGVRQNYASLTSSCKATQYPTTVATSLLLSTPTPTATCSGTTYVIQPTDTYRSVSQKQSVSTDHLLSSNGLPYNMTSFPKSGSFCISNRCKTYVLAQNDTCTSVAAKTSISTVRLKAWNANINELCSNLARFTGDTICISNPYGDFSMPDTPTATPVETPAPLPTDLGNGIAPNVTSRCGKYYKVDVGDDCSTVSLKFNIAAKDLVFLNPMLNGNCTNLWLNYTYCVQPVGDINAYPGYGAGPTATLPPFTAGPKTSLSWVDPAPTLAPGNIIIPLANDTRVDCHNYMWINGTNSESLDCWSIAEAAGLQREQFALWNPSIDKNAAGVEDRSYNYDCALQTSMSYCMGIAAPTPYWKAIPTARKPPSPRASGEIANCLSWMHVNTQLNCGVMLGNFDLAMSEFYTMNPSVGADCSNLSLGSYYCIGTPDIPAIDGDISITPSPTSTKPPTASGTPSPIQDGMVSGCTKFYPVVANDGCWAIANQNSISLDDFYAWNPAVGKDCATLQPNYYVCIGRASTTTSHATTTRVSTTSSATTTKPAAPGPTQSGIPANCNKWVAQKDGVYCYDMAQAAGISLDRLYALNPALNGDCSGLWPGYAYCVGTS